jgi:hypothetical protein
LAFVLVSTQAAPQRLSPAPHVVAQTPLAQNWPDGQALPQVPQLLLSVVVFTHKPAQG